MFVPETQLNNPSEISTQKSQSVDFWKIKDGFFSMTRWEYQKI